MPAAVGAKPGADWYAALPLTVIAFDVNTRLPALQTAVALGPYRSKVIVPVGVVPPDSVAVSVTETPIAPPPRPG